MADGAPSGGKPHARDPSTEGKGHKRGAAAIPSPKAAKLEAILFLARQPLGSRKLAQLAGLADGTKARTLVRVLNRRYDAEGSAFRVEEVAGGFQLMTRPKLAPWLRRLHPPPGEVRLSAPALETLAVVAYRQPVLRAEIEAIRGVQCGELLRQLMERDLVRIVGRSEELGRPLLYATSSRFLQVFGLRHLEDLPPCDVMPMSKRVSEDFGENPADPKKDLVKDNIRSFSEGDSPIFVARELERPPDNPFPSPKEASNQPHCSCEVKEETNMKT